MTSRDTVWDWRGARDPARELEGERDACNSS